MNEPRQSLKTSSTLVEADRWPPTLDAESTCRLEAVWVAASGGALWQLWHDGALR